MRSRWPRRRFEGTVGMELPFYSSTNEFYLAFLEDLNNTISSQRELTAYWRKECGREQ